LSEVETTVLKACQENTWSWSMTGRFLSGQHDCPTVGVHLVVDREGFASSKTINLDASIEKEVKGE
jgi:hypothetical protein